MIFSEGAGFWPGGASPRRLGGSAGSSLMPGIWKTWPPCCDESCSFVRLCRPQVVQKFDRGRRKDRIGALNQRAVTCKYMNVNRIEGWPPVPSVFETACYRSATSLPIFFEDRCLGLVTRTPTCPSSDGGYGTK
jgi:hypothetical protein